jgi:hypothetical protein
MAMAGALLSLAGEFFTVTLRVLFPTLIDGGIVGPHPLHRNFPTSLPDT